MTEDIERVRKLRDEMAAALRTQQKRLEGVDLALTVLMDAEEARQLELRRDEKGNT